MARDTNRYICTGRLCKDPEIKYLANQTAVASLSVAVSDSKKVGDRWEEVPVFIDIEVFGQPAEFICQYGKKGSQIIVEGKLRLDQWTDKNTGDKRSKLKVVADNLRMLGGKEKTERQPEQRGDAPQTRQPQDDVGGDSIPF